MQKWPRFVAFFVISFGAFFSLVFTVSAQTSEPDVCSNVVDNALAAVGTNCASVGRNMTCYGNPQITHTAFTQSVANDFYSKGGDHADLSITESVQTGPFDATRQLWGVNVMNVNADLPTDLSPQGLIFVQLGGVEVESAVQPSQAVKLPLAPITVSTTNATNLVTWPSPGVVGHDYHVLLSIPTASSLSVDAIAPAGNYVRVVYQGQVGWVDKSAFPDGTDMSSLPVVGPDSLTDFQSFFFRTGIGDQPDGNLPCNQAPSLLVVQGPDDATANIIVNQQPMQLDSTVVFQSVPGGDQVGDSLKLMVLTGLVTIYPGTPNEIIVPPGYESTLALCGKMESLGIEGDTDEKAACGRWSVPSPLAANELDLLKILEHLPSSILHFPIFIPSLITPSGVGGVIAHLLFQDPKALAAATKACASGKLPQTICQYLGIST